MRLFVALPVAVEVRRALDDAVVSLRDEHPDLSWTRPEGWHVTLTFLGRVHDDRVDEVGVAVAMAVAGTGAVGLRLQEVGRFGRRVLWCGVQDTPAGAVTALGERVQCAVATAGVPVTRRAVRPHLTLARARKGAIDEELPERVSLPEVSWTADRVVVYQSLLGRGPARYTSVVEVALTG